MSPGFPRSATPAVRGWSISASPLWRPSPRPPGKAHPPGPARARRKSPPGTPRAGAAPTTYPYSPRTSVCAPKRTQARAGFHRWGNVKRVATRRQSVELSTRFNRPPLTTWPAPTRRARPGLTGQVPGKSTKIGQTAAGSATAAVQLPDYGIIGTRNGGL
jgi:hypothetical protein